MHWSDDATLDLIFHLARSHASQPVVLALTYRGEEAGPRLVRLVADLERARVVDDLTVSLLDETTLEQCCGRSLARGENLGDDFVHLLHGLTEGNPFFVEETLKALIVAGDLSPTGGHWRARPLERVRVPQTAVEAVRRRLAALTVPARNVASTAAIAGRRFDFDLLQTLTNHDERELLSLVKELIAAQLVVEESAERFAFRHALTREAIYADLLARERVALHRQVAAALEQQHSGALDGVIEALAYHAWEAGDWELAARYAARAARHALALSAPREAVAHLDRAFAALERSGVEPYDRPLSGPRAGERDAWRLSPRRTTTSPRHSRVHVRRPTSEPSGRRFMRWGCCGQHATTPEPASFDARHCASRARLGDESLIARSLNRVGNWHMNLEQPQTGLPHHEEALGIFERLGDAAGVAETVDLIAMAHHVSGDQRAAAAYYERSVALFTELDDRRRLANALALLALCGPSYHSSSTTPFISVAGSEELQSPRSVRLAHEIGWRTGEVFLRFLIADCLAWRGEYDRAIPLAHEASAEAEEIDHLEWTAGAFRLLGVLSLELLSPNAAREHLETAYQIAQRLGSHIWIRWTAAPLAVARAALRTSRERSTSWNMPRVCRRAGLPATRPREPIVELSRWASVSSGSRVRRSPWLSTNRQ